jgi:hypothetical protein
MSSGKEILGIIYKIKNLKNGKEYIGQTVNYLEKTKTGKKYLSSYGIGQRLKSHFRSMKNGSRCPLHADMSIFCLDDFVIEELEKCSLTDSDKKEVMYINQYNTYYPKGYNCQKGGANIKIMKNKIEFYRDLEIKHISIKPIKKHGVNSSVRIMITTNTDTQRISFNSTNNRNYDETVNEARNFIACINKNNSPIDDKLIDEFTLKYGDKISELKDKQLVKFRLVIVKYKTFECIKLYIRTSEMTNNKQEKGITFGGKTIPLLTAYETAKTFLKILNPDTHNIYISDELSSLIKVSNSEMPK